MHNAHKLNKTLAYTDISTITYDEYAYGMNRKNAQDQLVEGYVKQDSSRNPARLAFSWGAGFAAAAVTMGIPIATFVGTGKASMGDAFIPVSRFGIIISGVLATLDQIFIIRDERNPQNIPWSIENRALSEMDYQFAVWAARKAHTKPLFPVVRAFAGGIWHGIRNNSITNFADLVLYCGKRAGELARKLPPVARTLDLFRVLGHDLAFRTEYGAQIKKEPKILWIKGTTAEAGRTGFHVLEKERIAFNAQGDTLIREALATSVRKYKKDMRVTP